MQLNLPVRETLLACRNLLIMGMGGGFDLYCGLPIYFDLTARGQTVHLANYSFAALAELSQIEQFSETLFAVSSEAMPRSGYWPEAYLAQWLAAQQGAETTIWAFQRPGVGQLQRDLRLLIERLQLDGILLIDGGVDSLVRGNEAAIGTPQEDSVSLLAVDALEDVPVRLLACIGLGAEQDMTYAHIMENIAALTQAGAFLGACALTAQMPVYQAYEAALTFAHDQPDQTPSIINTSIISAVRGFCGDFHVTERTSGSRLWISSLMALYWFFELESVARHNLFAGDLRPTETLFDAARAITRRRLLVHKRPWRRFHFKFAWK